MLPINADSLMYKIETRQLVVAKMKDETNDVPVKSFVWLK